MTFTLTITLGNDAMQTGSDVAHALRAVSDALDEPGDVALDVAPEGMDPVSVYDVNGNTVGEWRVTK